MAKMDLLFDVHIYVKTTQSIIGAGKKNHHTRPYTDARNYTSHSVRIDASRYVGPKFVRTIPLLLESFVT